MPAHTDGHGTTLRSNGPTKVFEKAKDLSRGTLMLDGTSYSVVNGTLVIEGKVYTAEDIAHTYAMSLTGEYEGKLIKRPDAVAHLIATVGYKDQYATVVVNNYADLVPIKEITVHCNDHAIFFVRIESTPVWEPGEIFTIGNKDFVAIEFIDWFNVHQKLLEGGLEIVTVDHMIGHLIVKGSIAVAKKGKKISDNANARLVTVSK